jgi:pimeloyl-ACP methyl ester carboxylesterase
MRGSSGSDGDIHSRRLGAGPTVVFIHGTMTNSIKSWAKQEALAERWTVVLPDRRGYEPNPPADRSDFEVDAVDIEPLLGAGGHLVGHSYGALVAIFTAARRPEAIRSLTLIEPPAHSLVRGDAEVERQVAGHVERVRTLDDPRDFVMSFFADMDGPRGEPPSPLPAGAERQIRLLMNERPPWDAEIPIDALRSANIPTLIVTGGHSETFDLLSDRLADALGPIARRAMIEGKGHAVQRTGEPFNATLEEFMLEAEKSVAG